MTLEIMEKRLRQVLMMLGRDTIDPLGKSIDAAIADAYAQGQRDMRERAAVEADRVEQDEDNIVWPPSYAVRALPIKGNAE